jgi:hypothetical protein
MPAPPIVAARTAERAPQRRGDTRCERWIARSHRGHGLAFAATGQRTAAHAVGHERGPRRRTDPSRSVPVGAAGAEVRVPDPAAGAVDQTFRLIVRPDLWGPRARGCASPNAFGTSALALDTVSVALQTYAGNVARGSTQR